METLPDAIKDRGDAGSSRLSNSAVVVHDAEAHLQKHDKAQLARRKAAVREYGRGKRINVKVVKDKKLRRNLKHLEHKFKDAALKAKDAEILHENAPGFLEAENELERTYRVKQDDVAKASSIETAQKRFELALDQLGPYVFDYSRTGRELLLGGQRGHIAVMDWREGKLGCELQLKETVRDVKWLHNNQYFAVAQKKYTYIYDRQGVELHCLRKLMDVTHMEFLPHHFLLATLVSPAHSAPEMLPGIHANEKIRPRRVG
jgi:U3 small nucleolar RNA-associated protein 7